MSDVDEWRDERENFFSSSSSSSFSCFGPVCIYWLKQPNFTDTAGTASIFSGTKQGGICTDLLAGTVYTGHTGRYGTKLTSLFSIVIKLLKIKSSEMLQIF